MSDTMKAVRIHEYGDRSVLKVENAPIPEIDADEVLVKIKASSVNPVDWKIREGYLASILPHKLPLILGWDFSGEIVSVGANVEGWQIGDAVYSRPNIEKDGTYAEYIRVSASEIARKPESLSWIEAAGVPLVTLTAWQSLYDAAGLKSGDRVLIHAGAGGVGSMAIQLAKLKGAYVYTTASTRNIEFLKSLGADEVIDYTTEDFSTLENLDIVFDTMGGEIQERSLKTLKKGGIIVSISNTPDEAKLQELGIRGAFCMVLPNSEQLTKLAELFDEGKLKIEIDSTFSLDDIAKAHEKSQTGRARGKIAIQVS